MKKSLLLLALLAAFAAPASAQKFVIDTIGAGGFAPPPPPSQPLPAGLHVQVMAGTINVTNPGGQQQLFAGQFGIVPSADQPPMMVPPNPGLQFAPPPAFSSTPNGAPLVDKSTGPECIVQ